MGEHFFLQCIFVFFIQKLDPDTGMHTKDQREITSNIVGRLHRPFGGGKCGKEGIV